MATPKFGKTKKQLPCASNMKSYATFDQIGGLTYHINLLKETILFPLMYRNVYSNFQLKIPRGVLFYGPPGTGKTLVAGAIAKEYQNNVTFFHRKGADILDKWVGNSEQRLKAVFKKAALHRPAIIFFDEIDGLAPTRSSRQDQVHASVVTTLLSLMDGLDSSDGVIVIGSTNRLDSIDPALRRPGRFDRELYFSLPNMQARTEILEICVRSWTCKPSSRFLTRLADITPGYSGSDLQALCSEAVLSCLRRNYPNIHSTYKENVNVQNLQVDESDFLKAKGVVLPSSRRLAIPLRRLSPIIRPLLQRQLANILDKINSRWPHFSKLQQNSDCVRYSGIIVLYGESNQGQSMHIAPALLHAFEHIPSFIIDIQTLFQNSQRTAEEICVQYVTHARQNSPSIVLVYRMDEWWGIVEETTRAVILSLLRDTHPHIPTLTIATMTDDVPRNLRECLSNNGVMKIKIKYPSENERKEFLYYLFIEKGFKKLLNYELPHRDSNNAFHLNSECSSNLTENTDNSQVENLKRKRSSSICSHTSKLQNVPSKTNSAESLVKETRTTSNLWIPLNKAMNLIHKSTTSLTGQIEHPPCEGPSGSPEDNIETQNVENQSEEAKDGGLFIPILDKHMQVDNLKRKRSSSICSHTSKLQNVPSKTNSAESLVKEPRTTSNLWIPLKKAMNLIHKSTTSLTGQIEHPPCEGPSGSPEDNIETQNVEKQSEEAKDESLFIPILDQHMQGYGNKLRYLYKRAYVFTTNSMTTGQLETFHDKIYRCMCQETQSVLEILENMETIIKKYENKKSLPRSTSKSKPRSQR